MMMNGPSASGAGPKRFSVSGRASYTDPFAELQAPREQSRLSTTAFDLFPRTADLSAFPVEDNHPVNFVDQNTELYEKGSDETVVPREYETYEQSYQPAQHTDESYQTQPVIVEHTVERYMEETTIHQTQKVIGPNLVVKDHTSEYPAHGEVFENRSKYEGHESHPGEYDFDDTEGYDTYPNGRRDDLTQGASKESITPELNEPRVRVGSIGNLSSIRGGQTPRTSPLDSDTRLSRIETLEDPGLTVVSGVSRVNSLAAPADNWFAGENEAEISILGHPTEAGPVYFPSKGRYTNNVEENAEFETHVDTLGATSSVLEVRSALAHCMVAVSGHPANRALFCQAAEAASFSQGPMRDAAQEATSVLLSCLNDSSLDLEDEALNRTATIAALGALWNMSSSGESTLEVIKAAKKAMVMFPADPDVQTNALGVLVSLAADRSAQRQIINLGCLDCVIAAVRAHPDTDSVVEHACQILAMFAKDLRAQVPPGYCRLAAETAARSQDPGVRRWGEWLSSL